MVWELWRDCGRCRIIVEVGLIFAKRLKVGFGGATAKHLCTEKTATVPAARTGQDLKQESHAKTRVPASLSQLADDVQGRVSQAILAWSFDGLAALGSFMGA